MHPEFIEQEKQLSEFGWCKFKLDEQILDWVSHALPVARDIINSSCNQHWFRYQRTWFAGVNVLENTPHGSLHNGPILRGNIVDFLNQTQGTEQLNLDHGQLSVCYSGYPQPSTDESEAAFKFRFNRDAAHIDGLLPIGTSRRRFLKEPHAYILGIPLVSSPVDAAPLVVWEESHHIIKRAFSQRLEQVTFEQWPNIDLTEVYTETRRNIFNRCQRVPITAAPGEAYVVHKHCLHGVAPWPQSIPNTADGRMICYFRPPAKDIRTWLYDT